MLPDTTLATSLPRGTWERPHLASLMDWEASSILQPWALGPNGSPPTASPSTSLCPHQGKSRLHASPRLWPVEGIRAWPAWLFWHPSRCTRAQRRPSLRGGRGCHARSRSDIQLGTELGLSQTPQTASVQTHPLTTHGGVTGNSCRSNSSTFPQSSQGLT